MAALLASSVMANNAQQQVVPLQQIADTLNVAARVEGDQFKVPVLKDVDIRFLGADYEQLITPEGNVLKPLTDTRVKVSFTVCRGGETAVSRDYEVVVPGQVTPAQDANPRPLVFPELLNWAGGTGAYTLGDTVVLSGATPEMAKQLTAEMRHLLCCKVVSRCTASTPWW